MSGNSERDYANSIYDSMAECGERLAKEQMEKEMSDDAVKRYGISKELAEKIDKEYDALFNDDYNKAWNATIEKDWMEGRKNLEECLAEAWNEAIEAAAKVVDQANRDGPYQAIVSATEIRKLKK